MTVEPVLEHREGTSARWLRERRFRLALAVGLAESLIIVFGDLRWFVALGFAALVFAFYYFVGRRTRFRALREVSWIVALSQTLPIIIPFVVALVSVLVFVLAVVLALVIVGFLLLDRR